MGLIYTQNIKHNLWYVPKWKRLLVYECCMGHFELCFLKVDIFNPRRTICSVLSLCVP